MALYIYACTVCIISTLTLDLAHLGLGVLHEAVNTKLYTLQQVEEEVIIYYAIYTPVVLSTHPPLQLEVQYRIIMFVYKPTKYYKSTPLFRANVWG